MGQHRLSVVIPYYNNERTLGRCLSALCHGQSQPPDEIVVVDDGSRLPAAAVVAGVTSPVPIVLEHSAHAGQSRATNRGVAAARGDLILFCCADIVASPTWIESHAAEHARARARGESVAVMGPIAYAPWVPSTPFLQYLSTDGPQFSFQSIDDAEQVDGRLLCAPNFSIERASMQRLGGFDEALPYGYQDTDLGLRLVQAGLRLVYRERAWVHHDHPNDVANFCRRNRAVGRFVLRVAKRHPQLFPRAQIRASLEAVAPRPGWVPSLLAAAAEAEALWARLPRPDPRLTAKLFACYRQALGASLHEGMLEGDPALGAWLGYPAPAWAAMAERRPQGQLAPLLRATPPPASPAGTEP